jgi:hypothetical protein
MRDTHAELVDKNKALTLTSWTAQDSWNPITMDRAQGVYFWDADGKRYIDWSSPRSRSRKGWRLSLKPRRWPTCTMRARQILIPGCLRMTTSALPYPRTEDSRIRS